MIKASMIRYDTFIKRDYRDCKRVNTLINGLGYDWYFLYFLESDCLRSIYQNFSLRPDMSLTRHDQLPLLIGCTSSPIITRYIFLLAKAHMEMVPWSWLWNQGTTLYERNFFLSHHIMLAKKIEHTGEIDFYPYHFTFLQSEMNHWKWMTVLYHCNIFVNIYFLQ